MHTTHFLFIVHQNHANCKLIVRHVSRRFRAKFKPPHHVEVHGGHEASPGGRADRAAAAGDALHDRRRERHVSPHGLSQPDQHDGSGAPFHCWLALLTYSRLCARLIAKSALCWRARQEAARRLRCSARRSLGSFASRSACLPRMQRLLPRPHRKRHRMPRHPPTSPHHPPTSPHQPLHQTPKSLPLLFTRRRAQSRYRFRRMISPPIAPSMLPSSAPPRWHRGAPSLVFSCF